MQVLELVIFAALAGVVLFQLYAVLGRRVGRQPQERAAAPPPPVRSVAQQARVDEATATLTGLAAVKARDPAFDPGKFIDGARQAYETIVKAFAAGDRPVLKGLTAPVVYDAFERAIAEREAAGRTEAAELLHPPRADLEEATVVGDTARVRVRFLAEVRSRWRDATGEAVDDRRTAESWTFERFVTSRDPNWTLTRVDAAAT